jgi:hypothetical protein
MDYQHNKKLLKKAIATIHTSKVLGNWIENIERQCCKFGFTEKDRARIARYKAAKKRCFENYCNLIERLY